MATFSEGNMPSILRDPRKLALNIDIYVNYEARLAEAEEKGRVLKEDRDYYAYCILRALEEAFKGKSQDEILPYVANFFWN